MYIDTHCHISNKYYSDIDSLIKKIKDNKVSLIINNSTSMEDINEVISLSNKYDIVYSALGFHPTESDLIEEENFNFLESHLHDKKVLAIGEIGLDYHYDNTDKERQIWIFKKQLEIAERYNIPVIIHSRDAIEDTYNILKKYNVKGSIHAFSGSVEMANKFIKLGFLIGVGGVVTFKNAKNIINVINNIDIKYILLETDSPYLTPEPYRGSLNDSSYIPIIARKIAEIKNIKVEEVEKITTDNAKRLFDLN